MDSKLTDTNYASKMDNVMSSAIKGWFNDLTKEELLAYIAEQPTITADTIRQFMANMDCVMAFDVRFSTHDTEAVTDFHTNG